MKNMTAAILVGILLLIFQTAVPAGSVKYGAEAGLPGWDAPTVDYSTTGYDTPATGIGFCASITSASTFCNCDPAPYADEGVSAILVGGIVDVFRQTIVVVTTHSSVGSKTDGYGISKPVPV